jgi:hypothetical protein
MLQASLTVLALLASASQAAAGDFQRVKRAAATIYQGSSGYQYLSCVGGVGGTMFEPEEATPASCLEQCADRGFTFCGKSLLVSATTRRADFVSAAVYEGGRCYGMEQGDYLGSTISDSECLVEVCHGDASYGCGGGDGNALY